MWDVWGRLMHTGFDGEPEESDDLEDLVVNERIM